MEFDDVVVLGFECGSELFFVEIGVIGVEFDFSVFVLFAFEHFEVELILVFELGLLLEEFEFVLLFVVVFGSFFVVFFLFEQPQVLSALDLASLSILPLGDSVFES